MNTSQNEYNLLDYYRTGGGYLPTDKNKNLLTENLYTLNQVSQVFTYDNLPETIPQRVFERYLMLNGSCFFIKKDGNYYVVQGGGGGILNYNYDYTQFVFSNPYLRLSGAFNIENEPKTEDFYKQYSNGNGILIRNDTNMMGIYPLIDKYNTLIVELDLTIYRAIINMRSQALITGTSKPSKNAVEQWYSDLEAGKPTAVLDMSFEEGNAGRISAQPVMTSTSNGYITSLIELRQYLKACRDNSLGINCNFNMKREALNTAECSLNDQSVIPLILDMFKNRLECIEKINKKYGLNIVVKLNNLWAENVNTINEEAPEQTESEVSENVPTEETETENV